MTQLFFYIICINSCVNLFINYWTLFDHLVDYNSTLLIRSCPSCYTCLLLALAVRKDVNSRPAFKISRALQVNYEDRNKFKVRLMQKLVQPPLNIIDERNVRITQVKQPQELDSPGHVIKGTPIWATLQSIYSKYTVHRLSCMFLPTGIPRLIQKLAMCVSYNNAEKEKHTAEATTSEGVFAILRVSVD